LVRSQSGALAIVDRGDTELRDNCG